MEGTAIRAGEPPEGCVNCGRPVSAAYCAHCGQRIHRARFSLRELTRQAVDEAFKLDRGLLHTILALSARPGRTVAEYVYGRTRPYTNPLKYLLICVAVATFAYHASGFAEAVPPPNDLEEQAIEVAVGTADFIQRYFNLMLIAGLPFLALFSRLFFLRSGRTIAEHLIFNSYVYAHQNLLFLLVMPLLLFTGVTATFGLYYPLIFLYYGWACSAFFHVGLVSGIARGLAVTLFAYGVSLTLLVLLVALLG